MAIYLIQVSLIGLLGLIINPKKSDRRKRRFLCLVFLILTIVSGMRAYSVGADTKNYVSLFNNIQSIGVLNTRIEMGFMTYLKLLHLLSGDPGIMLFASSIICVGAACLFAYHFSKDSIMAMMLYVLMGHYFSQMNIMRQSLALSLTEVAFLLLLSNPVGIRKKIISGLLIFLASTIHTIVLVAFIPYALVLRSNKNNENTTLTVGKALLRSIGLAVIGFVGYSVIMKISNAIFPQYTYYFSSIWSDANYNASLFTALITIVFAVTGACIFKNRQLNNIQRFAVIMLGFTIFFNVLSMRMEIWSRMAGVFSIYTYLLWTPEFTSAVHSTRNRWILNSCIILFSLAYMLIVLVFRPEWMLVVPYVVRT